MQVVKHNILHVASSSIILLTKPFISEQCMNKGSEEYSSPVDSSGLDMLSLDLGNLQLRDNTSYPLEVDESLAHIEELLEIVRNILNFLGKSLS